MIRSRRERALGVGVFLVVYSVLHAVSSARGGSAATTGAESGESMMEEETDYMNDETSTIKLDTWRPKRINCTPAAMHQFPRPLMSYELRSRGGLIIHVLVAIYTFMGLAIVCNHYFVSSLDRICKELKISPDVAGATFMAAGSSAPELATVIIGLFIAKDDIDVSRVIGSFDFNMMFVISLCALCAGTVTHLNWWPLCRDCFFYSISILIMLAIICDEVVKWPEALFMILMYVVYCVALHFNSAIERWAMSLNLPFKLPTREEQAALGTYKTISSDKTAKSGKDGQDGSNYSEVEGGNVATTTNVGANHAQQGYTNNGFENTAYNADLSQPWDPNQMWADGTQAELLPDQNYYRPEEYKPDTIVNPLEIPANAGVFSLALWYVVYPIHFTCRLTIPDCRSEKYRNFYLFTFFVSMLWISIYSYFMVWMIIIIGDTLEIPDALMGFTFVAAGVSVPDALSSLAVIKKGYGDMVVSNAVGSNVFVILICLGLPWFIQTAIIMPGSHVNVISKGLTYPTLSLLGTVVFLVLATHLNGWKLDRKYGIILMICYLLFISFALLFKLDVLVPFNLIQCQSNY